MARKAYVRNGGYITAGKRKFRRKNFAANVIKQESIQSKLAPCRLPVPNIKTTL